MGRRLNWTNASCYGMVATQFLMRNLDAIRVKGRVQPVNIFELLGEAADAEPEWLKIFFHGRRAYQAGDWNRAEEYFQEVLRLRPEDRPSQIFLSRVRNYREAPPSSAWQGVFTLDSK